jgi:predicted nucleotidyltransferase
VLTKPQVLDHYYVELVDGSLGVVVGNNHANSFLVGYVKYRPTSKHTLWRSRGGVFYERVVKTYTPASVWESTTWRLYIPHYDYVSPVIPLSLVNKIRNPTDRSIEVISRVHDELEMIAQRFIHIVLESTDVIPGITGSLLPKIHNPSTSDLDFVIYGLRESIEVVEFISENKDVFKPFNGGRKSEWSNRVVEVTGLSRRDVERFYRNWRRGLFGGKEYSVIYSDALCEDIMLKPAYKTLGVARIVAEVEGGVRGLNYPSTSKVITYKVVSSTATPRYDIAEVVSFEALYIPGLFEGGLFEIEGLLQCSDVVESCRLLIGARESRTYMKYYE